MRNRSSQRGKNHIWIGFLMALILFSCAERKKIIRNNGIYYAKLGDEMPAAGEKKIRGKSAADTLFADDDYEWRAKVLNFRKGKVFIEEDFYRSEVVNRIRIETPELKLKNGLKVGMTIADLREASEEWFIVPMPRFNRWDFYSRLYPRVHFVIDEPDRVIGEMDEAEWEKFKITDFGAETPIEMIVIY